ncbi:MAG: hypothetical protein M0004_03110 [Actinomycetota bacterium]|nr:hypothetical protein [Actinomycetota bacterium]
MAFTVAHLKDIWAARLGALFIGAGVDLAVAIGDRRPLGTQQPARLAP